MLKHSPTTKKIVAATPSVVSKKSRIITLLHGQFHLELQYISVKPWLTLISHVDFSGSYQANNSPAITGTARQIKHCDESDGS